MRSLSLSGVFIFYNAYAAVKGYFTIAGGRHMKLLKAFLDIAEVFLKAMLDSTAAESAIGLAIFVITFRVRGTIAVEFLNCIQG